jgi:hypothetical protein
MHKGQRQLLREEKVVEIGEQKSGKKKYNRHHVQGLRVSGWTDKGQGTERS